MKKNQGFSLVELIVVIAIMAVLVGVLAPAYLRYVEKSRKSTDVSAVSDIMAAAEKVAIDPQFDLAKDTTFTVAISGGKVTVTVAGDNDDGAETSGKIGNAGKEWAEMCGKSGGTNGSEVYTMKSKAFSGDFDAEFEGKLESNGSVTWTGDDSDKDEGICSFSPDFKKKWFS